MELYIHIPFCIQKCKYCDFLSFPVTKFSETSCVMDQYLSALTREISSLEATTFETVYFGGGTPSVFGIDRLEILLNQIRKFHTLTDDCEITLEINPATVDYFGLHKLFSIGFNRISIGLQSTNNEELKLLGRIHTYEDFLDTYNNARKVGFQNINIDLMAALPGQSVSDYINSLHNVISLNPEHISSYSLIIEEGTPFYDDYVNHNSIANKLIPSEEVDRKMYHLTKQMLKDAGYNRYEISNYAKTGFPSKHNSGYWKRIPYFGCGLGASSFFDHMRFKNPINLEQYINYWNCNDIHPLHSEDKAFYYDEFDILSKTEEMSEYLILGLRMTEGVSISLFKKEFGVSIFDVYQKELNDCVMADSHNPLLVIDHKSDKIYLTDHGMDVCNWIFEKFI